MLTRCRIVTADVQLRCANNEATSIPRAESKFQKLAVADVKVHEVTDGWNHQQPMKKLTVCHDALIVTCVLNHHVHRADEQGASWHCAILRCREQSYTTIQLCRNSFIRYLLIRSNLPLAAKKSRSRIL
jgi:hypothetical protein